MIDCDQWRRDYDTMTVADQRAFYSSIWREYREQAHFNVERLLETIVARQPKTVVELGGWDGECARLMLAQFPDLEWTNVEICPEACAHLKHDRYVAICPDGWYWNYRWYADLFVTSHTVEHLKARDLEATIQATHAEALYIDTPLMDEPTDWWGSPTTHIIEVGWRGVDEICARYGYELDRRRQHYLPPRSGGFSAVSVYDKVQETVA